MTCGRVAADDRDEPAGGLVDVGLVERVGVLVRRRVGHARVAVAEHDDLVEADDPRPTRPARPARIGDDLGLLLLRREAVERLARLAQRRVLQVALLAAGAAHEHRVHALGVVAGDGRRALGRLVVGVGVDGEQRQLRSAPGRVTCSTIPPPPDGDAWPRTLRRMPVLARAVAAARRRRSLAALRHRTTAVSCASRPTTQRAAMPTTTTTTTSLPGVPLEAGARRRPR